jgi:four helix bundle protein
MEMHEWEQTIPADMRSDPIWGLRVYRAALYSGELARKDAAVLAANPVTREITGQLVRAVGSISANIAEGYSRISGRDRAKFYEYALGSAREGRDWYYQARETLGVPLALQRMDALSNITRTLIVLTRRTRSPQGS